MKRLAAALCVAAAGLASPADASARVTHPAYSFEVPGGWKADKQTLKALDTVQLASKAQGLTGAGQITVLNPTPGTETTGPLAIPPWAKQGATMLGGAPARTALWERSRADGKGPVQVSIRITATRAGRPHVIVASYTKQGGDMQADRRFNVALSVVVRSWRWAK